MKTKEIRYETSKGFLTGNREMVLKQLYSTFYFLEVDKKTLVNDYFNFIQNSKYNVTFTMIIEVKDLSKLIQYSIDTFKNQYHFLDKNWDNINQFDKERKEIMWNSKSL